MQQMYPGIVNSPSTTLSNDITNSQTTITVTDPSKFPSAPNEATIGTGEDAETITYTGISGNDLTGVTRGFEGTAKAWVGGNSIGRNFTNYDYETLVANILTSVQTDHLSSYYHSIAMQRQAIINGNIDVYQRGLSFTNPVHTSYTLDRYRLVYIIDGGILPSNIVHSRQLLTPGDILNSFYFYRINVDGTGSNFGTNSIYQISQRIENGVKYLCGLNKKVTVSFYARSSITNKRIGVSIDTIYGSGGSPTASETINGSNFTLTSTWTKYTYTFTTNTLVGKTFGTDNNDNIQVNFRMLWGTFYNSQVGASTPETFVGAGDIDLAQIQVCAGDVALPFTPKSFNDELLACQRYYYHSWDDGINSPNSGSVSGVSSATNNIICSFRFPTPMRISPTLQIKNDNTDKQVRVTATNAKVSFNTVNYSGNRKGFSYLYDSGGTPFTVGTYYDFDLIADAEI